MQDFFADTQITWVKKTRNNKITMGQGFYFLHSTEMCLVGVKKYGKSLHYVSKVTTDVIFSEIQKQSQKPEEMYQVIEAMMPGAKKIELFGRNHNIRRGWLTLGNQLGEKFRTADMISCSKCRKLLDADQVRHKHKEQELSYCDHCLKTSSEYHESEFFHLENRNEENPCHTNIYCNGCQARPLWGVRYSCTVCPEFDLCESCFDKKATLPISGHQPLTHTSIHEWKAVEVSLLSCI